MEKSASELHYFERNDIFCYLSFILISFIFLAAHSISTSPCYIGYGGDSANFLVMGKMLLNDMIPYVDFFDHKGPMIILIGALGQSIVPDRLGLFIMQIINLSLVMFFIYNTGKLMLSRLNSYTLTLITLLFLAFTLEGGNLTEEYSLPYITWSVLLTMQFMLSPSNKVKPLHMLILGICGAILFWIRLNNMGVICACITFIFIVCIHNKNYKDLQNLILYFLFGMLIISLPIICYFYLHNALYKMIFAAFIYNLKYVGINQSPSPFGSITTAFFYILKAWIPFITLAIGTTIYYIKHKNYKIILFSTLLFIFGYITTHIGAAYYHYMTLNIPSLAIGSMYILKTTCNKQKQHTIAIVTLTTIALMLALYTSYRLYDKGAFTPCDSSYIEQSKDVISHIPANERNSIYAYQTMTRFHASSGTLPCFKYFMMQEWQGKYNPAFLNEINSMLENHSPLWVITQFRDQSINKHFWEIIEQRYELSYKNYLFELFRLKDSYRIKN